MADPNDPSFNMPLFWRSLERPAPNTHDTMEMHMAIDAQPPQDGFALLSRLSGIPEAEARAIAARVKANLDILKACTGHAFQVIPGDPKRHWDRKFQCQHCKGIISASDHMWYERGRMDQAIAGGVMLAKVTDLLVRWRAEVTESQVPLEGDDGDDLDTLRRDMVNELNAIIHPPGITP